MYKIAAIIGGVLLMAGVAVAGTVSSLGSTTNPTIGQTLPVASTTTTATTRQDHRRGREAEARGRANEPGEDLPHGREAEPGDDRGREAEPGDDRGGPDHGRHHGGDDRGGESGHGGHGGDD